MTSRHSYRPVLAIALAAALALVARYAVRLVPVPPASFFPPSFVTHSVMLALSVAAMWLLSKGRLDRYGLRKGTYEFRPRILMWVLPTAVLSIASAVASPAGQGTGGPIGGLTKLQLVVFVWVYASISEELLTRGLLQTLLSGNSRDGAPAPRRLSMPVLVSALFFGSMHIVLVKSMGPAAVPVILLAVFLGLIAARYREKTGSLLPAIIVHALFNIGGMLPLWVIQWLRG
jgi:membrane protease YdiL (CAAX protease family)